MKLVTNVACECSMHSYAFTATFNYNTYTKTFVYPSCPNNPKIVPQFLEII